MNPLRRILARLLTPSKPASSFFWWPGRSYRYHMSQHRALTMGAVWACCRFITGSVAQIPWPVYKKIGNKNEQMTTHPVAWVLNTRANPEMSAFNFRQTMILRALILGNAYAEIERDQAGRVIALWPIDNDRVIPDRRDVTGELYYRISNTAGAEDELSARSMFHLVGMSDDGIIGIPVIMYAARSIALGIAQEEYGYGFFDNSGVPSGVLEHPAKLSDPAMERLRKQWEENNSGPSNSQQTLVLEEGMTYKSIALPPEQAQFLASRQNSVEEICFLPGTEVLTSVGPKPIDTLKLGDLVLTHKGRFRKITNVMRRSYVGRMVNLQAKGLPAVTCTPNHPFLVQKIKSVRGHWLESGKWSRTRRQMPDGGPVWTSADALTARVRTKTGRVDGTRPFEALMMPRLVDEQEINKIDLAATAAAGYVVDGDWIKSSTNGRATWARREVEVGFKLGFLCGHYVSEGSVSHAVHFSIGKGKLHNAQRVARYVKELFGLEVAIRETETCHVAVIYNRVMASFFAQFGRVAHLKHFPDWAMRAGRSFRKGLLVGVHAGDGSASEAWLRLHSTSWSLIWQLRIILYELGYNSFLQSVQAHTSVINGQEYLSRDYYTLEWHPKKDRRGTAGKTDQHLYFSLDSLTTLQYSGLVYNIEVEEDESYTTIGGICHNCRWFGVPPQKAQQLVHSNYNSIEHLSIEVISDTLMPWAKRLEQEANYKLLSDSWGGIYSKMDFRGLMRGTHKDRAEYYRMMFGVGAISINEIREKEDLDPVKNGDLHLVPLNMAPLDRVASGELMQPLGPQKQEPNPPEPTDAKLMLRFQNLLEQTLDEIEETPRRKHYVLGPPNDLPN